VAIVATRLTLASDWPTQLRGPSANGKYLFGLLLSPAQLFRDQDTAALSNSIAHSTSTSKTAVDAVARSICNWEP
jgi:hypothetical protein